MFKYLKLFDTHSEYESFVEYGDMVKPNISYCKDNEHTHYNPFLPLKIIKYTATSKLTEVISGNGLHTNAFNTTIEKHTFKDGKGVIEFSEVVTLIGNYAFYNCNELTDIDIPNGVTSIGNYAFSGCRGLTNVDIPNSVMSIGNYAFSGCGPTIYITTNSATGLTYIECDGDLNITIGNGVTTIGNNAFAGCPLTTVDIPNSVTHIDTNAFMGCRLLTSVIIGNGITRIDGQAFHNCTNLASVTIYATTAPTLGSYAFSNNASGRVFYVPSESISAYGRFRDYGRVLAIPTS